MHDETDEMSMGMPASLKMKIQLEEEEAANAKNFADARARMAVSSGAKKKKGGMKR